MENSQQKGVRSAIEQFLKERFDTKAEKLQPDDPKYQALVEQFQTMQQDALANYKSSPTPSSLFIPMPKAPIFTPHLSR